MQSTNEQLAEMLGKTSQTIFTSAAALASCDFYCVHFPIETAVSVCKIDGGGSSTTTLQQTYPAGTTLFLNVTAITVTSGLGIGYHTDTAKG
tara:strand:- start:410 stop:685 length:276 start_codon:yes stop_codon:yes gene_type:complete